MEDSSIIMRGAHGYLRFLDSYHSSLTIGKNIAPTAISKSIKIYDAMPILVEDNATKNYFEKTHFAYIETITSNNLPKVMQPIEQ